MAPRPSLAGPVVMLLALAGGGCGDLTAIDLTLVADPNVNDTSTLVEQLRSLRLVVSAEGGLYDSPPPSPGPDLQLVDIDGDGQLDLVADRVVAGLDRLPRLRLEQGGLRSTPLDLRFDGGSPCQSGAGCQDGLLYFAAGGVKGARFVPGTVQQTEVPFNVRLLYRQPQVTQVNPEDGARDLPPESFGSVVVIFSKKMNPDSLRQPSVLRVVRTDAGGESDLPLSAITVTNLGGLESPAVAECQLGAPLESGSYHILVSTGALDVSGRPLDQVPMQPGDQGFSSSFTVVAIVKPQLPCPPACACSSGGDQCPPGLTCDAATRSCTPQPGSCPSSCPAATVCDSAHGLCVPDCRVYGSYGGCPEGESCAASGLCGE